jgi:hypothetical protein
MRDEIHDPRVCAGPAECRDYVAPDEPRPARDENPTTREVAKRHSRHYDEVRVSSLDVCRQRTVGRIAAVSTRSR